MRALAKRLLSAFALAALAAAAPAQMPLVGEEAIAPGARACLGLGGDVEATRQRLRAEGWSRGKFRAADGKALRDPGGNVEIYGREGLLILLTTDPAKLGCMVTAKAKAGLRLDRMVSSASAVFGTAPFATQSGQALWRLGTGQAIMLRHQTAPEGASIQFVFTPTEKKL